MTSIHPIAVIAACWTATTALSPSLQFASASDGLRDSVGTRIRFAACADVAESARLAMRLPDGSDVTELRDDEGNRIQLWCIDKGEFVDEYALFFIPPGVDPDGCPEGDPDCIKVGRCPFEGGANSVRIITSRDVDPKNGTPDRFLRTAWAAIDQVLEPFDSLTDDDCDGLKDGLVYSFDVATRTVSCSQYDFGPSPRGENRKVCAPVAICEGNPGPSGDRPLVGGCVAAVFECATTYPPGASMPETPLVPFFGSPMLDDTAVFCDLDRDGDCDDEDVAVIDCSLGDCIRDSDYNPDVDFDGDGCVTEVDKLFLLDCNDNGRPDLSDVNEGRSADVNDNGIPDECECLADFDGDGDVGFDDLATLLAAWGNEGGPEDLDGSGTVGLGDLLTLLSDWGPCP